MSVQKPTIPKGTRDFSPFEMVRRNFIFNAITSVFKLFGYQPIETPSMENLSTLLGKYGEEGDKLIFKILNSGDFLDGLKTPDNQNHDSGNRQETTGAFNNYKELVTYITEKGLRYDLTVPFARFVVAHQHEIAFPFKRYQIQPVWRADRPQKGRYREFFQCDVDVIGSLSLLNEVELVRIINAIFSKLGISVRIHLNNRKVLAGIADIIGSADKLTDITVAVDKLDKIGLSGVNEELLSRGIPSESVEKLQPILFLEGTPLEKVTKLSSMLSGSPTGLHGISEMHTLLDYLSSLDLEHDYEFDVRLARGLSYYTGTILEVKAQGVEMGSICGGGRYDNLTKIFGLDGMSGVGISFGADRIFDVMNELNLFPENLQSSTKVLFINFGDKEEKYCLKILESLHRAGLSAEIYPDQVKVRKQMEYANRKNIPFVILIGQDEMNGKYMTLKDMRNGVQQQATTDQLISILS